MAAQSAVVLWRKLVTARPFFLMTGPNVLQGRDHALRLAERIARVRDARGLQVVFKSSFDKANRTSLGSFRGPGMAEGLAILEAVKRATGLPVITDIHEPQQAAPVAEVCDVLQIPAFLCRQTDLLAAAAATQRVIHIKKGQFASAQVAVEQARKVQECGNPHVLLCERGNSFGYSDLVVDFRNLVWMKQDSGLPVVLDVTHCLQRPSAQRSASGQLVSSIGADSSLIPAMGAAAVAVGVNGLFLEVEEKAFTGPCDGNLQWPIDRLDPLLDMWTGVAEARQNAKEPLE